MFGLDRQLSMFHMERRSRHTLTFSLCVFCGCFCPYLCLSHLCISYLSASVPVSLCLDYSLSLSFSLSPPPPPPPPTLPPPPLRPSVPSPSLFLSLSPPPPPPHSPFFLLSHLSVSLVVSMVAYSKSIHQTLQ